MQHPPRFVVCTLLLLLAVFGTACTAESRAEGYVKKGDVKLSNGDTTAALEAYDRALESLSDYGPAHRGRGQTLRVLGRGDEAMEALERAIELMPEDAPSHTALGRVYLKLSSKTAKKRAARHCEKATELDPNLGMAWGCACVARAQLFEAATAVMQCKKAVTLDPDNMPFVVFGTYARMLDVTGDYEQAAKAYEDTLRKQPDYAELYYRAAAIYVRLEQQDKALEYLNKAIELDPSFGLPHRTLAGYYISEGDVDKAREHIEKATALGAMIDRETADRYRALLESKGLDPESLAEPK